MPRIERKIEVNASQKRIFDILDNVDDLPIWNLVVNSVKKLEEGKYEIDSTVGESRSTRLETVPNDRISTKQEGGPMSAVGYVLSPKGDSVEVMIWGEFDNEYCNHDFNPVFYELVFEHYGLDATYYTDPISKTALKSFFS